MDHVAQERPHRPASSHREVLEESSEELVEQLAVRDEVAEAHEEAPHPEQRGERQVPEGEHVEGVEREELKQLLTSQRREERGERCSVMGCRDRDDRAHAGRQPGHVDPRRQLDARCGEQAHVESAARVADQMERTPAVPRRRGDRLGHPGRARRERRRGRRPHDVDARLEPQRGEALGEEPPHVSEVSDPPEVREPEEARNQVDVVRAAHSSARYSAPDSAGMSRALGLHVLSVRYCPIALRVGESHSTLHAHQSAENHEPAKA